jgi:plastocyanin
MVNVSCGKSSEASVGFRSTRPIVEVAETPCLEGTVVLTGGVPSTKGQVIDVGGNPLCSQHGSIIDPTWRVSENGGLADVVVSVKNGPLAKNVPEMGGTIDQKECLFLPNVAAVQVGQAVRFKNSDMTFHNVRVVRHQMGTELQGQSVANYAQASMGGENTRVFDEPGVYRIECDVHRWMRGWIVVNEGIHFGVSDSLGKFQISRALPDGDYVLEAWHPQFSEPVVQNVRVSGGKGAANFEFKLSSAFRS